MNSSQRKFEEGELLVLPDGKILAHNITPEMAAVLSELDPENKLMKQRMTQSHHSAREKTWVASASGGCVKKLLPGSHPPEAGATRS
ncbi:MAG: hypothetical protein M3Y82_03730 [Verrucomicrobiota bacterium]|nr:hypothetical protein [Verrucomicrobiota bacterium]